MNTIHSLFVQTKKRTNAFTIVELLVVIGIISVLAITLLVMLNPAEAQRRSRDAKRMKDISTIQAIIESYINDGGAAICTTTPFCTSNSVTVGAATPNSHPCAQGVAGAGNWIGPDLCVFAKTIPSDPINLTGRACVGDATACELIYRFAMNTQGDYEINVRQEATGNAAKVTGDSGNSVEWVEVFSNAGTILGD